jgi:hypothetical protein
VSDVGLRQLDIGQRLKLESKTYTIDSYIVYEDEESSKFIEYELKNNNSKKEILWLCVGINYDEVSLFKKAKYSDGESSLLNKGYELIEDLDAKVINYEACDLDLYERVHFKEFEHKESKNIFSIETWEDETSYSESVPIKMEDIEILDEEEPKVYNSSSNSNNKKTPYLKYILLLSIPIIILIVAINISNKNSIEDYLNDDPSYIYDTSITSDADSKLKADVYYTDMSMDTTVEFIVNALPNKIEDVQSSQDEYSVAILTKYEYALVYIGMDNKTYIQVSPREYIYSSHNDLYNAHYNASNIFYRDFYYSFGYKEDSNRYKNRVSPYAGYRGNTLSKNSSDKYRQLKSSGSSIKRGSVFSRSSSGGGLSSGK